MWTIIVTDEHNTCIKHSRPLVLNDMSKFPQCFTVMVNVYCLTTWEEVNEQIALHIPEHHAHHFPYRQHLFEFRPITGVLLHRQCIDCCLVFGVKCEIQALPPVTILSRNLSPLL
ncbi:hypothetical protein TNCV_1427081 [Trichonephila clavipes]|nr:hypothetical protein TNCV_1427081 [Trichonephila clavipes]